MYSGIWLLLTVIAIVAIVFAVLHRPMYEAMAVAFVAVIAITGNWPSVFRYIKTAAGNSLLYTIVAFMVFSSILEATGVIHDCIDIILAVVGKLPGGSGLVSLIASCFMGALSGSGPGNVAATGSITIPLMKKSGYSSEFAAGICMSGSCLGPVIPPSSTILTSFACLAALEGFSSYTVSDFWMVMYGVSMWLIIQRIIQFYLMFMRYGPKNTQSVNVMPLKDAWKKGWKSFLIVFVIMIPFLIDSKCGELLSKVWGEKTAAIFSKSVLIITPSVASVYCILVGKNNSLRSFSSLAKIIQNSLENISSMVIVLLFSYAISGVLSDVGVMEQITMLIQAAGLSFAGTIAIIISLVTLLGMFMSGTSLIPLFGTACIAILSSFGANPVVIAALLPVLFVSLGQMTPPFAMCMYGAMAIAESDFKETSVQAIWWSFGQLVTVILMIVGVLPVLGT